MNEVPPKVLVVDDNREITDIIYNYCRHYESEFATIATNRPEHVMRILDENEDVRVVVSDFKMPVINGLELLIQVKQRYPAIQFILMTAYGTKELRRSVEERGAVRYLEKPFEIKKLVEIIRDLLRRPKTGYAGFINSLPLSDISQFIAMSGGDAELKITAGQKRGTIYFKGGSIIHSDSGTQTGLSAFFEIFDWEGGKFVVSDLSTEVPRSIHQSWESLLLDVPRLEDVRPTEETAKPVEAKEPEAAPIPPELPVDRTLLSGQARTRVSEPLEPEISLEYIYRSLDRCVDYLVRTFPKEAGRLPIRELPLRELPPLLRRHLIFHFHHISTSAIRSEGTPFDFTDERVAKAALNLLEALLDTWRISAGEFRQVIERAVRFHLARSVDPGAAIAEFLFEHGEGRPERMRSVLTSLIVQQVVGRHYEPLVKRLEGDDRKGTPAPVVEGYIRAVFEERSREDGCSAVREAMNRIMEILAPDTDPGTAPIRARRAPLRFHLELLDTMFKSRGLTEVAEFIRASMPPGAEGLTTDEVEGLMRKFSRWQTPSSASY